ncbi:btbd6a [Symbiodinium pilosum]|uniref:Btbd6a protein n=1 Tax=Symbiodinium pilosum TaxID=2952 RepID=A0A812UHQ6_SYMPI|nr:btbd6a [Symbiodinium pilosum]
MANNFAQTLPARQFGVSDAKRLAQMYIGQQNSRGMRSKEHNRAAPSKEDELNSFQFAEEPDDPRVAVPAHRIGDEPEGRLRPYVAISDRSKQKKPDHQQMILTAMRKPLHSTSPPSPPGRGAHPVLANAGLLQFMLPNFGFPPTIAEEASLEQLLLSPSHHDERFQLLET